MVDEHARARHPGQGSSVATPRGGVGSGSAAWGLSRRQLLRSGLAAGAGLLCTPMINRGYAALTDQGPEVSIRAIDLVGSTTVIDMLGLLTTDWRKLSGWYREPANFDEREFRRLESTGIKVFHPAVETDSPDPHRGALRWMSGWTALLDNQACFMARIKSLADLIRSPAAGKISVLIGFQNSSHFRTVADVAMFHSLGQRVSQLTYNLGNRLGGGCWDDLDRGLSPFGVQVVAEMNRVGMVVDVSHCGERTSLEAIEASTTPVLATHSNCRSLVPGQPRNKSDDVIRKLAASGGVMGITLVRPFVTDGPARLDRVLDHFDHVARLVGVEHVGLGSDLAQDSASGDTGPRSTTAYHIGGLDPGMWVFQLTEGLLGRGYRDPDVRLVLGGNFARALGEIWSHEPWAPAEALWERRDPFCPAPSPIRRAFKAAQARVGAQRGTGS